MAVRIGLSTGKEWGVDASAADVIARIHSGAPGPLKFESEGREVHIYREHIAYIEDELPGDSASS
jgi:hypothetical protein